MSRKYAQHHPLAYEVMLSLDLYAFLQNGGGPIGYSNSSKFQYAKWRASPERTMLEKALFWDTGIFYYTGNPPKEYSYPPLFEKN
jgi:hypothetical protein